LGTPSPPSRTLDLGESRAAARAPQTVCEIKRKDTREKEKANGRYRFLRILGACERRKQRSECTRLTYQWPAASSMYAELARCSAGSVISNRNPLASINAAVWAIDAQVAIVSTRMERHADFKSAVDSTGQRSAAAIFRNSTPYCPLTIGNSAV